MAGRWEQFHGMVSPGVHPGTQVWAYRDNIMTAAHTGDKGPAHLNPIGLRAPRQTEIPYLGALAGIAGTAIGGVVQGAQTLAKQGRSARFGASAGQIIKSPPAASTVTQTGPSVQAPTLTNAPATQAVVTPTQSIGGSPPTAMAQFPRSRQAAFGINPDQLRAVLLNRQRSLGHP